MTIENARKEIDLIDERLISLLNERMQWVQEVGKIKNETKSVIYRPEREKWIVERMVSLSKGPLSESAIEAIFLEIFAAARNI